MAGHRVSVWARTVVVAAIVPLLLLMGFFLEALAMTVIMAPVLYPALAAMGWIPSGSASSSSS